jgi:hypothetical protein
MTHYTTGPADLYRPSRTALRSFKLFCKSSVRNCRELRNLNWGINKNLNSRILDIFILQLHCMRNPDYNRQEPVAEVVCDIAIHGGSRLLWSSSRKPNLEGSAPCVSLWYHYVEHVSHFWPKMVPVWFSDHVRPSLHAIVRIRALNTINLKLHFSFLWRAYLSWA